VTLVSPADGATVVAGTLRLVWNAVPLVPRYQLQISTDAFESVDATIPVLDTTLTVTDLAENKQYWWRVLADAFEDQGPFSDPRSFYLQGISGVAEQVKVEEIRETSIAPDPASDHTAISFHLASPQPVSLEVFDAIGRPALLPLRDRFDAGDHLLPIDVTTLAEGIYFYRLTASGTPSTGEFTVRH
jgi:hypothetical protein